MLIKRLMFVHWPPHCYKKGSSKTGEPFTAGNTDSLSSLLSYSPSQFPCLQKGLWWIRNSCPTSSSSDKWRAEMAFWFLPSLLPKRIGNDWCSFWSGHGTSRLFTNVFMAFGEHIPFPGWDFRVSSVCCMHWLAGWRVLNLVLGLHNEPELQERRLSNLGVNSEHFSESNQPEFSFSAGLSLKLSPLMIGCLALVNMMDLICWNWFSHKEYTWEK